MLIGLVKIYRAYFNLIGAFPIISCFDFERFIRMKNEIKSYEAK